MDGATAIYGVLSGFSALTDLVALDRIVTDDVLPAGGLPALQIETVSGTDLGTLQLGATVHVRQRIRIRIHAATSGSRAAVRAQVRRALFAGRFPVVAGLGNVAVHTDGEGPDGLAPESNVRIGLQDAIVTYTQAR